MPMSISLQILTFLEIFFQFFNSRLLSLMKFMPPSLLQYSQHSIEKVLIGYHLFIYNCHVLKFENNLQILIFFMFFFQILNSKLGLMNFMPNKLSVLLQYSQQKACVKNIYIDDIYLPKVNVCQNLNKTPNSDSFQLFVSIFKLKITVFVEVYAYT